MVMISLLQDQEYIEKEISRCIDYDPETGYLTWKASRGGVIVGDKAGNPTSAGYLAFNICGKVLSTHRVCWFLYYGEWPRQTIDHINRVKIDNRIKNLRDVSQFKNCSNRSDNKSGVAGVYWNKRFEKWHSQIMFNKKRINLGLHEEFESAVKIRREAESYYHGHKDVA